MKKRKLFLLPLFCLLLAGCGGTSQSGDNKGSEEQVTPTPGPDQGGEETPSDGGGETPAPVVNNAALNITEKALIEDETFELSVSNIPEGMTPSWSKYGDAISYVLNEAKTSATVKAEEAGQGTILVVVGEKVLSCTVNVTAKRVALPSPVLALNTAKNGLTWAAVTGAEGYIIKVNDADPVTVTDPGYAFSQTAGTYAVQVTAKADLAEYNSVPATFNYETKIAAVGQLQFVNNNAVTCASAVGMGVEAKLGDGEYAAVTNNSLAVTQDGTYTFHAKGGFDEENNFFYVEGDNAVATIAVVIRQKLAAPVLGLNTAQNGCTWAAVADAEGYSIKVNEEPAQTVTEPGYAFATVAGQYHVVIKALADLPEFDSEEAEFDYEVKYTALGNFSVNENKITWDSFVGAKLQYKLGDGEFTDISGNELVFETEGNYTFRAVAGIGASQIYYVDSNSVEHEKVVAAAYPEKVIVEKGLAESNEDLMEQYELKKYASSGWVDTTAIVKLDNVANEDYTDGNCMALKYWRNATDFRYRKAVNFYKGYDTLTLAGKGDGYANFRVSLAITKEGVSYGNTPLTGVYATYTVDSAFASSWNKYTISMNDANWKIAWGNGFLTPAEVQSNLGVEFKDLLPFFDAFSFLLKKTDSDNKETFVYVDDVEFSNDGAATGVAPIEKRVRLRKEYAVAGDGFVGKMTVAGDGASATIVGKAGANKVSLPAVLTKQDKTLTISVENQFTLAVDTNDYGESYSFVSATGAAAALVNNAALQEMITLDAFNYEELGQGYDQGHAADAVSGMRAHYYADYYSGGSGSPIGGSGWSLMGGSYDYSKLTKTTGYFENGCAELKSSSAGNMRYISGDLAKAGLTGGAAPALGSGYNKLSLMVKGSPTRAIKVTVYAYYQNSITKDTQQLNRTAGASKLEIAQNADWAEYAITLDTTKTYYGFSIVLEKDSSGAAYLTIDDIVLYKTVSPF